GADLGCAPDSPIIPGSDHLLPVVSQGLGQPFMFMGAPPASWGTGAWWKSFWTHTPGWKLDLTLRGASGENAYKDAVPLLPPVAAQTGLSSSVVTKDLGAI